MTKINLFTNKRQNTTAKNQTYWNGIGCQFISVFPVWKLQYCLSIGLGLNSDNSIGQKDLNHYSLVCWGCTYIPMSLRPAFETQIESSHRLPDQTHIKSLKLSGIICHRIWSSLAKVMACHLFGAKPLPEPMLTYFIWSLMDKLHWNFSWNLGTIKLLI